VIIIVKIVYVVECLEKHFGKAESVINVEIIARNAFVLRIICVLLYYEIKLKYLLL